MGLILVSILYRGPACYWSGDRGERDGASLSISYHSKAGNAHRHFMMESIIVNRIIMKRREAPKVENVDVSHRGQAKVR